jgi:hypothetical protein
VELQEVPQRESADKAVKEIPAEGLGENTDGHTQPQRSKTRRPDSNAEPDNPGVDTVPPYSCCQKDFLKDGQRTV